ncbi:MAG: hypothetical protein M3Y64_05820, partial [Gemmatimonadota bacterium]|nr:hypothetical protein [Gemmatimonadota bacterium]
TNVVTGEDRVVEVARMLGGDADREVSRAHARELLHRGSHDVSVPDLPSRSTSDSREANSNAATASSQTTRAGTATSQRRGKRV